MKKIIIIIILLSTSICSAENLTPQEFLQVIKKSKDCLTLLETALKNSREKSIIGSGGIFTIPQRKREYKEIKSLFNRSIKCFKDAKFKDKTIFYNKNNGYREYTVLMIKPDITEDFIIENTLIENNINILEQFIKEFNSTPEAMNTAIGKIDQVLTKQALISAAMDAHQIRMESVIIFNELSKLLNPETLKKIEANSSSKDQILKSINKFIWFCESTDKYLQKYNDYLHRIRELLIQSSNGIYTENDRIVISIEIRALIQNCQFIIKHAKYNNTPIFHNNGSPFRNYTIKLYKSEPDKIFRIFSPQIFNRQDILQKVIDPIPVTAAKAYHAIVYIDKALENVSLLRAHIGAFYNRLEYVSDYYQLLFNLPEKKNNETDYLVKSHLKKIEMRSYELAIQSANGIYTDEDRRQVNIEYQELIEELNSLQKQTGFKHAFSNIKEASVSTQKKAENEMLRLSKILKNN